MLNMFLNIYLKTFTMQSAQLQVGAIYKGNAETSEFEHEIDYFV